MQRHGLDTLSLVFGIIFVLIGLLGLIGVVTTTIFDLRWLLPALLIAAGVAVLVTGARRGKSSESPGEDQAR